MFRKMPYVDNIAVVVSRKHLDIISQRKNDKLALNVALKLE